MDDRDDRQFDWIDDAFDDKRTAEDIEHAKGPKLAIVLLVAVLAAVIMLVMYALVAIPSALG